MAATLAETLAERRKKNKSGTLTRSSEGQLRERSIAGSVPLSPVGAKLQGIDNPDVAKMVGDARQKRAALDENVAGSEKLSTQLRQKQAGRGAEATAGAATKSPTLMALGGLGDQVHSLVQSKIRDSLPAEAEVGEIKAIEDENRSPEEQAALDKYLASGKTAEDLKDLATAVGLDPATEFKQLELELTKYFEGDAGASAAAQIGNFEISEVLTELGYDEAALTELGITGEINTFEDLEEELARIEAEEFSQVSDLQKQAFDPQLSEAERGEARDALADAGAVGIREMEGQISDIVDSIEGSAMVEFAGEQISVEELLSNDGMTEIIRDYINNPDDRDLLIENEPGLADFIDKHIDALEGAVANIIPDETAEALVETQKNNTQIVSDLSGAFPKDIDETLREDILKELIPGYQTGWTSEDFDVSEIEEALDTLKTNQAFAEVTQMALNTSPSYLKQLMKLDKKQIKALGLDKMDSGAAAKFFKTYHGYRKKVAKAEKIAKNPETAGAYLVKDLKYRGQPLTFERAKELEMAKYYATGVKSPLLKALEDPVKYLKNNLDQVDLAELAENDNEYPKFPNFKGTKIGFDDKLGLASSVLTKLGDGKLTSSEIQTMSASDVYTLLTKLKDGKYMTPAVKKKLKDKVKKTQDEFFSKKVLQKDFPMTVNGMKAKRDHITRLLKDYKDLPHLFDRKRLLDELESTRDVIDSIGAGTEDDSKTVRETQEERARAERSKEISKQLAELDKELAFIDSNDITPRDKRTRDKVAKRRQLREEYKRLTT
jgi:hypothetical protein